MYKLIFVESYLKKEKIFIKKHPEFVERYKKVLRLLELNPFHPSLRLHNLKGKLKEYWSVYISLSYRIILKIRGDELILLDIGDHEEVY